MVDTAQDYSLHENGQENHQSYADACGDYPALDFLLTSGLTGRHPALALDLFFSLLSLAFRQHHLGDPGLARGWTSSHGLSHGEQIRAARFAELQVVTLISATLRTEH